MAYKKYEEICDGVIIPIEQVKSSEAAGDARETRALCSELLQRIVLETEKEVVFLPYESSMWGSLENI